MVVPVEEPPAVVSGLLGEHEVLRVVIGDRVSGHGGIRADYVSVLDVDSLSRTVHAARDDGVAGDRYRCGSDDLCNFHVVIVVAEVCDTVVSGELGNGFPSGVDVTHDVSVAADGDADVTVDDGLSGRVQISGTARGLPGCGTEHLVDSSPSSSEDVVEDGTAGDVHLDGQLVALGTHGSPVSSAVDESDGSSADIDLDGLSRGHVRCGGVGPRVVSGTEQHRDAGVVGDDYLRSLGTGVGAAGTVGDQTARGVPDLRLSGDLDVGECALRGPCPSSSLYVPYGGVPADEHVGGSVDVADRASSLEVGSFVGGYRLFVTCLLGCPAVTEGGEADRIDEGTSLVWIDLVETGG